MPIQDRKYFIQKHNIETNKEMQEIKSSSEGGVNDRVLSGETINAFAALEQQKNRG